MADFRTHVLGAALVSGSAATALEMVAPCEPRLLLGLFALGTVGGLLPDLDADNSFPVRIAFSVLSVLGGFLPVLYLAERLSLLELLVLGLGTFGAIRFGVFHAFTRLTVHRGLWHSIPAALVVGQGVAGAFHHAWGWTPFDAWLAGGFVMLGFFVHLALDELYSVDLLGRRIRRSFGSALCLGSARNLGSTLLLYGVLGALYLVVPPPKDLLQLLQSPATAEVLWQRLLPIALRHG